MKRFAAFTMLFLVCSAEDCESPSSDKIQSERQERILMDGANQVGVPNIKNHREMSLLKDIYELRDQAGFSTFTYLWPEVGGKLVFLCNSIGYPIPAATQFTNPQKIVHEGTNYGLTMPQADPNGLFSPASAEGTWVMCKDPRGDAVKPVYIEPRVVASPFSLL